MTEREIFLGALQTTTPAERVAFLDRACGHDPDLRRQVEALVAEHEQLGSYLESPADAPERTSGEP
jgi:eukaryotic-like serine/threonine-protein kinase